MGNKTLYSVSPRTPPDLSKPLVANIVLNLDIIEKEM
ncbi:hypothetical protein ACUY4R_002839 [Kosakonia sp. BK9b]